MAERDYMVTGESAAAPAGAPVRSAEEIRRDIASRRESITDTVDQLSNRFEQTLDWRTYVSNHPLAALGVAAGIGFLASGLFRHRVSSKQRITNALARTIEDMTDRVRYQLDTTVSRGPGLMGTVKSAAFWAIARAASGYLRNRVISGDTQRIASRDQM
jgi:ElaB/YqjD/DUF883 family membrane-anchored ribosome-binding protein